MCSTGCRWLCSLSTFPLPKPETKDWALFERIFLSKFFLIASKSYQALFFSPLNCSWLAWISCSRINRFLINSEWKCHSFFKMALPTSSRSAKLKLHAQCTSTSFSAIYPHLISSGSAIQARCHKLAADRLSCTLLGGKQRMFLSKYENQTSSKHLA